jgi:hypothetical protein
MRGSVLRAGRMVYRDDLDGVGEAFDELSDPDRHCRILVVPNL